MYSLSLNVRIDVDVSTQKKHRKLDAELEKGN